MCENIKFRTLTGEEYEIPANPAQLIEDLIITLQTTINDESYTNISLIYKGRRLDPSDTVSSIGEISDDDYIIIKNSKAKAKPKLQRTDLPKESEGNKISFTNDIPQPSEHGPCSQPIHRRPKRGLPIREEILIPKQDPPDFEDKVDALMELGNNKFSREDVEKALRVSFFNPDRASTYLFSGNIPDVPEPGIISPPKKPKDSKSESGESTFDLLTPEHQELVIIISQETGKDLGTVLQVADACDFNETNIRNCLEKE